MNDARKEDPKNSVDPRQGRSDGAQEVEPVIDPDSAEREHEEIRERPHGPSRFDAGTGQGTVSGPPKHTDLQERPILDGSTQSDAVEASVPNPYRGQADPAQMKRQPALNSTSTDRWLFAGMVAYVLLAIALVALSRWDAFWCGVGLAVGLLGLVAMLIVRATGIRRPLRLRIDAVLLTVIWLVPLAIILTVMISRADQIW